MPHHRAIHAVVAAATAAGQVARAVWAVSLASLKGDTTCKTKEPPFFLNGGFHTVLAMAVMSGHFAAGGFTLRWAMTYVLPPYVAVMILVTLVNWRRYPQHCAHCDHPDCMSCSTAVGVPPARNRRLLNERLTTAGWYVDAVDDVELEFCPEHAERGREVAAEQRHAIEWVDIEWDNNPAPSPPAGSPILVDHRVPQQRRSAD